MRLAAYSQGTIFRTGRLGSIVEIKCIQGLSLTAKKAAEQHGLELCKSWIGQTPLTLNGLTGRVNLKAWLYTLPDRALGAEITSVS